MIAADRYYIELRVWPRRRPMEIVTWIFKELVSLIMCNAAIGANIHVRVLERGTDAVMLERKFVARADAEAWREAMTSELGLPVDVFERKFGIRQHS